ncbi:putative restriction endonuclease [Cystobacter fuscus DSM 2262]|uniref:Restriction endonuclease n=1 Tax=Cystobacter fuscus (strain ATCC 25194 / DSM 2262 / NBRC 100088 / M29) TaxID=1242864 RepID=S9QKG6_CYSF2|nr:HNH endonuclease [Cystobacter fuscus]EPX61769.1 putative restriction endonuclease [Cystobacter fuscus DSM 2262]
MTELAAYLELGEGEARRQWLQVRERIERKRQEPFLPIEVLLCYALFFVLNPHSFGGSNINSLPDGVKLLAHTLRRTPGSLTSKMLNLDGSRKNSARLEPELFSRLAQEPDRFAALYQTVLRAARDVALGPERVPDVLGVLQVGAVELLGQDELGSGEIDQVLHEHRGELVQLEQSFHLGESRTTRLVEQRVRLGQHRFATRVLENYAHRCGFCGFAPSGLRGHRLLVASHIKPWAVSTDKERMDVANGITACPTHDAAFDTGLLTINGGLRIHRAQPLRASMAADAGTEWYFGERILGSQLVRLDPKSWGEVLRRGGRETSRIRQ